MSDISVKEIITKMNQSQIDEFLALTKPKEQEGRL